jgi:hypothetical protein
MIDDMAEDGLLDVGISLEELLNVDELNAASALDRIVVPQRDGLYYGFNSSI